jgi:hypothetical protein
MNPYTVNLGFNSQKYWLTHLLCLLPNLGDYDDIKHCFRLISMISDSRADLGIPVFNKQSGSLQSSNDRKIAGYGATI